MYGEAYGRQLIQTRGSGPPPTPVIRVGWERFPLIQIVTSHRPLRLIPVVQRVLKPHHSFIHQRLYSPLLGPSGIFSFVIIYTISRSPWTVNQPVTEPLPTHMTAQRRINTHRHPCVEWDSNARPQRSKTVHALGRADAVIGFETHQLIQSASVLIIH
jgi:hypothetical protein